MNYHIQYTRRTAMEDVDCADVGSLADAVWEAKVQWERWTPYERKRNVINVWTDDGAVNLVWSNGNAPVGI